MSNSLMAPPTNLLAEPLPVRAGAEQRRTEIEQILLSVVVVHYRQWDAVARLVHCLSRSKALQDQSAEIVLVDNHSPPHRVLRQLRRAWGVSVRRWRRNFGFARAVNEGCRLSRGAWIVLLNPDVELDADWLDQVRERLEPYARQPDLGIVGFELRDRDGAVQGSHGPFPNLFGTFLGLLRPRAWRKYERVPRRRVSWATGCALLIRRDCWEDLRGFNPDFFLYYEDVDLCRRARARGWTVAHDAGINLVHLHPLHQREHAPRLHLCTRHGLLTYARKHWPSWQFHLLAWGILLECAWRCNRTNDSTTRRWAARLRRVVHRLVAGDSAGAARLVRRAMNRKQDGARQVPSVPASFTRHYR